MTTAFVLSGGGSLGAVQVGMLQALVEAQIYPDLFIGTSVGALNAAYVAHRGFSATTVEELGRLWRGLSRHDVFPLEPFRLAAAAMSRAPSICSATPLSRLAESYVGSAKLEEMQIPVHVIATDVTSGIEVVLSSGNAVQTVMASSAIPAVFPAVEIDGRVLVDGGISNNTPISHALKMGADQVFVLPTGFSCALEEPPHTALSSAVQALTLLIQQRLLVEVSYYSADVDVRVMPSLCPLAVASTDFNHTAELIERAYGSSARWLADDAGHRDRPERYLSLHDHRHDKHHQHLG